MLIYFSVPEGTLCSALRDYTSSTFLIKSTCTEQIKSDRKSDTQSEGQIEHLVIYHYALTSARCPTLQDRLLPAVRPAGTPPQDGSTAWERTLGAAELSMTIAAICTNSGKP